MYLKLRILFTVLTALCLAAIGPIAVWFGWVWFFAVGGLTAIFWLLMLVCKQKQEEAEAAKEKKEEEPPHDFFNPQE